MISIDIESNSLTNNLNQTNGQYKRHILNRCEKKQIWYRNLPTLVPRQNSGMNQHSQSVLPQFLIMVSNSDISSSVVCTYHTILLNGMKVNWADQTQYE